jgi:ubiquinone/menaquinone biosynthesis C-methylase UbiE
MLIKLFPKTIKRRIRDYVLSVADSQLSRTYLPSHPGKDSYCVGASDVPQPRTRAGELPIPPPELWLGYGTDPETYLSSGQDHVNAMVQILRESNFEVSESKRVLEFGCAAGRMIRHLVQSAPQAELTGVDIGGEHISWGIENLTPSVRFAHTTILPHLPFEDRYFDLIFCGSVFTHIEDIAETWLLELARVLRPGGRLYLTIHDETTVELFESKHRDHWLAEAMRSNPTFSKNKDHFKKIVIGRGAASQVFYHSEYFKFIVPPCLLWDSITPEAYGYQSAVVLQKRS